MDNGGLLGNWWIEVNAREETGVSRKVRALNDTSVVETELPPFLNVKV